MARKFQIGDTVQVVKDASPDSEALTNNFKVGHRGEVTDYAKNCEFKYHVERKNGNDEWFNAPELKLIKRKTKKVEKNDG